MVRVGLSRCLGPLLLLLALLSACCPGAAAAAVKAPEDNSQDGGADENGAAEDSNLGGGSVSGSDGGIDIGGLQKSLKDGGIEGLNNMLKAFATMGSVSGGNNANMHITKDADGHEVYDFRDLDASTPAPLATLPSLANLVPGLQPLPLPAATNLDALPAIPAPLTVNAAAAAKPVAVMEGTIQQQTLAASTAGLHPLGTPNQAAAMPARAETPPARQVSGPHVLGGPMIEHQEGALAPAERKTPAVPQNREMPPARQMALPIPDAAKGGLASVMLRRDRMSSTDNAGDLAPSTPGDLPEVSSPSEAPQVAPSAPVSSSAGGSQLAVLASGLEEVRRNVDTLVTLALRNQGSPPVAFQRQDEMPLQSQQLVSRVEALERQNAKLEQLVQQQAGRLEAVEADQQHEERELGEAMHENGRLRAQLLKTSRRKVLLSRHAVKHSGGAKPLPVVHESGHIRTFFHNKGKGGKRR